MKTSLLTGRNIIISLGFLLRASWMSSNSFTSTSLIGFFHRDNDFEELIQIHSLISYKVSSIFFWDVS